MTEKQDTMLLDRCMLEETTRDMDLRHKEEVERLRVEFQLERSELRQKRREASNVFSCPPYGTKGAHHMLP